MSEHLVVLSALMTRLRVTAAEHHSDVPESADLIALMGQTVSRHIA